MAAAPQRHLAARTAATLLLAVVVAPQLQSSVQNMEQHLQEMNVKYD
jgi:hypothetical protein